jgi:hypothetical protein
MARFVRKTFNDTFSGHPLEGGGASPVLQFIRDRRSGPWGGTTLETTANVLTGGMFGLNWSAAWGALSMPFEIPRAAVKTMRFFERLGQTGPEFAGPWVDTRMAYTMRRAALQAMHDSAYSLRGAIGNEARLMHR